MSRTCPICNAPLDPMDVRCRCGTELPEARDLRSDPSQPRCGLCGTAMELMVQRCPSCGAIGYPALRSRQGKKSRGAGDALHG
jgi:hypothetical protein